MMKIRLMDTSDLRTFSFLKGLVTLRFYCTLDWE